MPRLFTPLFALGFGACGLSAVAVEYPVMKSGLWEIRTKADKRSAGPEISTMCLDESIQKEMIQFAGGLSRQNCSKNDMRMDGNKLIGDSVCKFGESTLRSQAVTVFSGNSSYRTEVKGVFNPPFLGQKETFTIIEAKHIGACKPGQRPGDLTLPGGQTFNIKSMMQQ